jgi:hypothetical protein
LSRSVLVLVLALLALPAASIPASAHREGYLIYEAHTIGPSQVPYGEPVWLDIHFGHPDMDDSMGSVIINDGYSFQGSDVYAPPGGDGWLTFAYTPPGVGFFQLAISTDGVNPQYFLTVEVFENAPMFDIYGDACGEVVVGQPCDMWVGISNLGGAGIADVEFSLDGTVEEVQSFYIYGGQGIETFHAFFPTTPGWHEIMASIIGGPSMVWGINVIAPTGVSLTDAAASRFADGTTDVVLDHAQDVGRIVLTMKYDPLVATVRSVTAEPASGLFVASMLDSGNGIVRVSLVWDGITTLGENVTAAHVTLRARNLQAQPSPLDVTVEQARTGYGGYLYTTTAGAEFSTYLVDPATDQLIQQVVDAYPL